MAKYSWLGGGPKPKVDAELFGAVVEKLAESPQLAKPEDIVEAARSKRSAIHSLFEWDDDSAAEAYRRQQARHWIGRLQIVRVEMRDMPAVSSRAFYSVRPSKDAALGYASQQHIVSDRDLKLQVIGNAKRELESYITKYAGILTMGTYIPQLQAVMDGMRDEVDQLATDAAARRPHRSVGGGGALEVPSAATAGAS